MLFNLHHRYLTTDSALHFHIYGRIDLPRTLSNNNGSNENHVYVFDCTICCSNRKISAADFYSHRHIQFIISTHNTVCYPRNTGNMLFRFFGIGTKSLCMHSRQNTFCEYNCIVQTVNL